ELRMLTNQGSTTWIGIEEMRVLATDGVLVTDVDGGGAAIASVSGSPDTARNVLTYSTSPTWYPPRHQTTDQEITVRLRGSAPQTVNRLMVDSTDNAPRNVQVWVSTTGTDPADFTQVASRVMEHRDGQQWIVFDPVPARYVQLRVLDAYRDF